LEVISVAPRAFIIYNFLHDFEVDEIIKLAKPMMHLSSVGDAAAGIFASDTRTSSNAWLSRETNKIIDSLFKRAGVALNVDEKLLTRNNNAEDIQVVHYQDGQKYDSHHDWGVSGYAESRFITLLLYLNDMESPNAGGETSFPKANNGLGIKVHPGKGNAVLFYNLLEDGNGDDLALHAALPIIQGEKWLANFWVWDPKKK
jgi:prolyl 4-hydroxylase